MHSRFERSAVATPAVVHVGGDRRIDRGAAQRGGCRRGQLRQGRQGTSQGALAELGPDPLAPLAVRSSAEVSLVQTVLPLLCT